MNWDKLRIFHTVAEAGSFTHAGDIMHLSQSAISRQISALEHDLKVTLFRRHARGLVLTEQGELLFRTVHEVFAKLDSVQAQIADLKNQPTGELKVSTTVGLGSNWLAPRLKKFFELYPQVQLDLILSHNEVDLGMREADVAIRMREPVQPGLIRRKLFTVHFHIVATATYLRRFGEPQKIEDLSEHNVLVFGDMAAPHLLEMNALETLGMPSGEKRAPLLKANNLNTLKYAVMNDLGLAVLPDYLTRTDNKLITVLGDVEMPSFDTYFCYPEELKNSARVNAFRTFMLNEARDWVY